MKPTTSAIPSKVPLSHSHSHSSFANLQNLTKHSEYCDIDITFQVKRSRVQHKVAKKNKERSQRSEAPTVDPQILAVTLARANDIKAKLSNQFRSLVKSMVPSNVNGGFWMGLTKRFCEVNMPKVDTMIVLEDENGEKWDAKYLARKVGLSGGWKQFSNDHILRAGDVLVFHLIEPSKFKVYIVRYLGSKKVDVAPPSSVHCSLNQQDTNVPQNNDRNSNKMICDANNIAPSDGHENTSDLEENLCLEVSNENRLTRYATTFQEVSSVENFSVMVDGLVLDPQLPQQLKIKYYELCCSQNMFLHEYLLGGQNCQLVVGMIREIVTIADDIKASKITTPSDSFVLWFRKLKCLEMWGMNVSFLLARIEQLMRIASKTEEYREARNHRERAEEEKKDFERKLEEVKETITRLDDQIDSLNLNLQTLEAKFQGLASAPW
ncbi:hypothetical protein K1719_005223 [Acacia pycnantha]|nr:hypothetical protein K1719_005223 [Acacia pycnantha]